MLHLRWSGIALLMLLLGSVLPSHAQDDRVQILASHSILSDVAATVAGDAADVTTLMPRGADPHSFTPTPRDMTRVADADVVLVNGALFEEGLLEAIANADAEVMMVAASACVPMLATDDDEHGDDDHSDEHDEDDHSDDDAHDDEHDDEHSDDDAHDDEHDASSLAEQCDDHAETIAALYGDAAAPTYASSGRLHAIDCGDGHSDEHDDDHSDDDAHDDEDDHSDDDHAHGACDPHVWLVPSNVMYWTLLIRDTLIERDPANSETYTANADAYLQGLAELDMDTIRPLLETLAADERVLVTNHEAFGYFGAAYDFEIVDTIIRGGGTTGDPSAADVASVIDVIREREVPAIFTETTAGSDIAQQVAAETGAAMALLYSGSLGEDDSPASTYLDFMRYNVTTIVEALGNNG